MQSSSSPPLLVRIIGLILVIVGVLTMALSGSCAGLALMVAPVMEHGMNSDMFQIAGWAAIAGLVGLGLFLLGQRLRGAKTPPKVNAPLPPQ